MIQFQDAHFRDNGHPITLESSMQLTGAYAGIHDYDFEDLINEPFDDLDDWTPDGVGTYVISSGQLSITGAGAARYYRIWHNTLCDPSFVLSFDLVSGPGQIVFLRGTDAASFSAWWTSTTSGFATVTADGVATTLLSVPEGIAAPARIQLAVKYTLDVDTNVKWLQASLFADGRCITSYTKNIGGTAYDWVGSQFGLSVTGSNVMVVDNLTISAFARIVEWTTIDVGDNAASGTSRAVGTTRLARQARFNGTARIWRPGNRASDWTIPEHRPVKAAYRKEKIEVVTHVRTRGVLYQVDVFNDDEGLVHLHRFLQTDDPNLFSKEATESEATKVLHDAREKQYTMQLDMPPNPALEPHDRITYNGGEWRVVGIQRGTVVSGNAIVPKSTINAQQYIELT